MPGFLGGSSGSSGSSGEISFPKEFIDPVTKLRVSQPENLIDTDFEYGLQPTKWETVELINNTPSFFSKSGDTTIPNITSITTNDGTREITVVTSLEHGLAVGIPINVTGTKSITADGAYIINSIPNTFTFTYLCKDNQSGDNSIEDLYSSIITGEFFQGSQLRVSDSAGIVTDAAATSILTVTTESVHGFGVDTPFYFLNLNSTISQEFAAANTETKSFDSSNSAVAQTFDGSNTLSSINIDWSNSATVAGTTSTISGTNTSTDVITVAHGTENFSGKPVGTPLYYNVTTSAGFFNTNPRGVVFLKTNTGLGASTSSFTVSDTPDGTTIDIQAAMSGTFQLANQARTFAGNNVNPLTQTTLTIVNDTPKNVDAANNTGEIATVASYSGQNVTASSTSNLASAWYQGAMVFYSTTGVAASGLVNNTTYWIDSFFSVGGSNYLFNLKATPTGTVISSISGGTGTQTFTKIGVSLDKDIFHVKDHGYVLYDMLRYDYPADGRFGVVSLDQEKNFYFVSVRYDQHNFALNQVLLELSPATQSRTGTEAGTAIAPTEVTAIGAQLPITYAVTSGTLPAGLTLNVNTGVVSGTPSDSAGTPTRTVIITATDAAGSTASQTHTYQFNLQPFLYAFTSATFTPGGAAQYNSSAYNGPNISQARSGIGNPTWSNTYLNMSTNGVMLWTVPKTGSYRVAAFGAGRNYDQYFGYYGGYGAQIEGQFSLTQGEVIHIVVGHKGYGRSASQGSHAVGGGNGGSFVVKNSGNALADILVIAGGGGGPGAYPPCGGGPARYGVNANTGQAGLGNGYGGGNGGGSNNSLGYAGGDYNAGGGAGFYGNGGNGSNFGPLAFVNGARGGYMWTQWGDYGISGGFGGGGGAGLCGGGAGGYSGGPAGEWCTWGAGGGGGSYNNGSSQTNTVTRDGDGYVVITQL